MFIKDFLWREKVRRPDTIFENFKKTVTKSRVRKVCIAMSKLAYVFGANITCLFFFPVGTIFNRKLTLNKRVVYDKLSSKSNENFRICCTIPDLHIVAFRAIKKWAFSRKH